MCPTIIAETLLFTVFRTLSREWHYFKPSSATFQQAFDEYHGFAISNNLIPFRSEYFQRLFDDGVNVYLNEYCFNCVARYTVDLFPNPEDYYSRLVAIACLGELFVHYGIEEARWWVLRCVWFEVSKSSTHG